VAVPQEKFLPFSQDRSAGESATAGETPSPSSPVLVLDLRRNATFEPPSTFFEELQAKLPVLQRIEIAGDEPLASKVVHRVLQCLREPGVAPPPPLLLRVRTVGTPQEVGRLLADIPNVTVRLDFEGQPDWAELKRCLDLSGTGVFGLEVRLRVGPSNWYEVGSLAALCDDGKARLHLTTEDAEGRCPIFHLPLDEIRFVCLALGAERDRFADTGSFAGISLQDYDLFLAECRKIHHEKTEHALRGGPMEAAGSAGLRLPPLTHPTLRDESATLALLHLLGRIVHSPAVSAWLHEVVSAPDFPEQATTRFSLRWLALWGEAIFHDPPAIAALRATYRDETSRERLLLADRAEIARLGLESSVGVWAQSLGLDKVSARQPPFVVPTVVPKPTKTGTADVTILIPSYNHEAYLETALRSALAQTYPDFRVLVVDDCSLDATVERAKGVAEERVTIEVRPRNLGLGNNVLEALSEIRTPYVAILNSDDVFHPERLDHCRRALEGQPGAVIAATGIALVDAHGRSLTPDSTVALFDGPEIAGWVSWYHTALQNAAAATSLIGPLFRHNFLATSSNLFCRTSFLHRRANTLRNLKYCLDWQLFLDAALEDALVYLPEKLLAYRLHAGNTVWFREGGRWAYLIEVNQILASGLRRLLERAGKGQAEDQKVLEEVLGVLVEHVTHNTEADGFTLFLHALLGEGHPKWVASSSPQIRKFLEELEHCAKERRQALYLQRTIGEDAESVISLRNEVSHLRLLRNAGEVWEDTASHLRGVETFLRQRVDRLETEKGELLSHTQDLQSELDRAYASREWQVGALVWNRLGLSKVALPALAMLRRWIDWKNRCALSVSRKTRRHPAAPSRAVVASTWNFPIYFHTFVYQEMQGLRSAGFDVKVFCWKKGDRQDLHPGFRDLWRNRVVLQNDWSIHQSNLAHFRRTRPEQVKSFLQRLAAEEGLTEAALLQDPIVVAGFTFARYVEVAGTDYLHSYFFYDQSFMAMMAAYLLGIPRGITAYADHMLQDYSLKCVRLNVELADLVVATSRRIRDELSAIGGGRFDSKILVKPNGIDLSRFPYIDPAERLARGGEAELIAVNRIEPKKGLLYLAEATRILMDRGVGVRLHLVGSVDPYNRTSRTYAAELEAKVRELGIGGYLVMHGVKQQPDVVALLARSRIFVAPYIEVASGDKDGIPTAVLEAMATGLPIVTTDAGSILEAVTNGVEAICVPQRDPVRLAQAIERLLRNPDVCARMGKAGRQRVEAEYSIDVTERPLHERIRALFERSRGG